jgi:NADH dehydrogenase
MRPILVVGATGLLGSEICRILRGSDHQVRGLVRPGSPREDFLQRIGVETVQGDLRDVRSLERACRGVSTVISTANAVRPRLPGDSIQSVDRDGQRALVDAARRGGVRRFIYISVSPNLPRSTPLVRYKREVEMAVRGSGMAWVIVQPSSFLETSLRPSSGFDPALGKVAVLGSGEAPVSFISVRDVASAVAGIAGDFADVTRTSLPLGGPEPASVMDIVQAFEHDTGRRFHVVHAPTPVARGMGFLLRPFYPAFSSRLGIAAHKAIAGDVIERTDVARMLVPHPTTMREYVRDEARAAVVDRVRLILGGAGGSRA